MNGKIEKIYYLGKNFQSGDEISLIMLIDMKRNLIKKVSYGDEDCYQYIIERLIKGIKKYRF